MTDLPPPPVPPARATWWQRTERRFQRLQRLPLTMMIASLLAGLGIVQLSFQLVNSAYRSVTWSAQTRETLARTATLEQDVRVLQDAVKAHQDPTYLRALARCRGFVAVGERVVVASDAPETPPGENCKALRVP
ncbi:cell division protein FtsB [Deinococcus aquaticus]|uniref:Cell division protein FtsB n=1 Tax=Deinococcus aquaticus TaxID=328692 RepID=A0ABY7V4L8_9DEIO|nr:cell division protein FtsB [Deinococcus aquaticus]WDA59660.1 cell division protein FtsB [Deinococcus aquaticus]